MSSEVVQIPNSHITEAVDYQVLADLKDEIAHVLFLDLAGFTKLKPAKQRAVLGKLQEIVRQTEDFCTAKRDNQLIALPTGDGMALVFLTTVGGSGPAISCAERIATAIMIHNNATSEEEKINVRMGIHTGNIVRVSDINDLPNVAGEGINTAQRVMDCGDIGHILLSDHAVNFLPALPDRSDWCRSLGKVKVKHDQEVSVHSFSHNEIGNEETPKKIHSQVEQEKRLKEVMTEVQQAMVRRKLLERLLAGAVALIVIIVLVWIVAGWATKTPAPPSLAVLPLTPGTQKNSSRAISKGLTEQFMRRLKYMTNIEVKPMSTVRSTFTQNSSGQFVPPAPGEAAKKLKVRYVLMGTAESYSNDPNLSSSDSNPGFLVDLKMELYDMEARGVVWKEEYLSTPFVQLIPLQDTIVKSLTAKMRGAAMVTGEEAEAVARDTQKSSSAHWRYMSGRFWSTERPTVESQKLKADEIAQRAITNYREAINLDKTYARAHAGLTDMYTSISGVNMDPREAREKAVAAAVDAQNYGDNQAEVYASIGTEKWWLERDFSTARIAFLLAIKLDDQFSDGHKRYSSCLAALGDHVEARKQIDLALRLEQESTIIQLTSAQNYFFARDYVRAINQLRTIIKNNPKMSVAYRFLAMAYEQNNMKEQALEELKTLEKIATADGGIINDSDFWATRGHILARTSNSDEALKIALNLEGLKKENKEYVSSYNIALVYAGIPNKEADAFRWLDKAIVEFDPRVAWLKVDPRFAELGKSKEEDFKQRLKAAGFST